MKTWQKHIAMTVLTFLSIFIPQYITTPSVIQFLVAHPWVHDLISVALSTLCAMGVYKKQNPITPPA